MRVAFFFPKGPHAVKKLHEIKTDTVIYLYSLTIAKVNRIQHLAITKVRQ